jgi:hypothetical protein
VLPGMQNTAARRDLSGKKANQLQLALLKGN